MVENKRKWAGHGLSNSYTMGCPPIRGENPRALASGLSYVQVDKHGITIYTTFTSVDLAHHKFFRSKVTKAKKICVSGYMKFLNRDGTCR